MLQLRGLRGLLREDDLSALFPGSSFLPLDLGLDGWSHQLELIIPLVSVAMALVLILLYGRRLHWGFNFLRLVVHSFSLFGGKTLAFLSILSFSGCDGVSIDLDLSE